MLPASMEVAPYSPKALAKLNTAPERIPGAERGRIIFQKIFVSDNPKVLPACTKSLGTKAKLALAFLYIRGREITVAAIIQPKKDWTILMPK